MSDEPEDKFVWHVTVERCGFEREYTFICVGDFDRALATARDFLGKRHPNRLRGDPRFSRDDAFAKYVNECPHDPDIFIKGLKRGHELSGEGECEW